jgi:hypothetical protein
MMGCRSFSTQFRGNYLYRMFDDTFDNHSFTAAVPKMFALLILHQFSTSWNLEVNTNVMQETTVLTLIIQATKSFASPYNSTALQPKSAKQLFRTYNEKVHRKFRQSSTCGKTVSVSWINVHPKSNKNHRSFEPYPSVLGMLSEYSVGLFTDFCASDHHIVWQHVNPGCSCIMG